MAKTSKKTSVGKNSTTTTKKDNSKLTGRQQLTLEKIKGKGKNARLGAILGTGGEAAATVAETITAPIVSKHQAEVQKEQARQKTYQAAISKWNGILKSTPDAVDGTNPGMEGSNASKPSSTGTNPEDIYWG